MNPIRDRLKSGKTVVGTAGSVFEDNMVMLADSGLDFILFDTQHLISLLVSLPSMEKLALCWAPLPSTREKVWLAPASGSVAVRAPTALPVCKFSATAVAES